MLLDLAADRVAVLIGHDDVGDDGIGRRLFELSDGGRSIARGDDGDVLAAKGNLDDFAHGGAVVNEIDGRRTLFWRGGFRRRGWEWHGFAHCDSFVGENSAPFSAAVTSARSSRCASSRSREDSSTSRMASSIRSVAE